MWKKSDEYQKQIEATKKWINQMDNYSKTLGPELEKEKANKTYLNEALKKLDQLIKTGDQHKDNLNQALKALQMSQSMAQMTGGAQNSETAKQLKELETYIQKVMTTHKALKEFREKITKYLKSKDP